MPSVQLSRALTPLLERVLKVDTIWIATLSNGETVYQDDILPDSTIPAWIRLGDYCRENELHVTCLELGFRRFRKKLPSNKEGYFFCKSLLGAMFSPVTLQYYTIGYVEKDIIHTQKWKVPELVLETESTRGIEETFPEALIMRNGKTKNREE